MPLGNGHDPAHATGHAGVMDRENRLGLRRNGPFDQGVVDIHRVGRNIDKSRLDAEPHKSVDRRNEREGGNDNLVAGLQVAKNCGHLQRCGARRRHQHPMDAEALFKQRGTRLRKVAIGGDIAQGHGLGNVIQLFSRHERFVEGYFRLHPKPSRTTAPLPLPGEESPRLSRSVQSACAPNTWRRPTPPSETDHVPTSPAAASAGDSNVAETSGKCKVTA